MVLTVKTIIVLRGYTMGIETAIMMSAIGSVVGAIGAMEAANQQAQALEYNAKVAERNAQMAKDQADYEAKRQGSKMARLNASQRVAYLASGVMIDDGTAMDVMIDTTTQGEMDRLAILYGGDVESVNYRSQAASARMEAAAVKTAGMYRGFSTLLGGAGSALGQYRQGQALRLIT